MGTVGKKKILAAFHKDSPRLQGLQSFPLLQNGPTLPFISSPSPFNLNSSNFPSSKIQQREPCGLLLCAGGKGALD